MNKIINSQIDETVKLTQHTLIKNSIIEGNSVIGENVVISYGSIIIDSIIGDNAIIEQGSFIKNSIIGEGTVIKNSHIEDCEIHKNCKIGPYARLREHCEIFDECKIGNFVEIKKSKLGAKTKVSHLAYVGDAEVGEDCNIGCGVIFVNYNGKIKQKISVGDNCFIGCNTNLIAPLKIERNSYICAGATITQDIEEFDFVIGRVRQEVKKNRAQEYLKEVRND